MRLRLWPAVLVAGVLVLLWAAKEVVPPRPFWQLTGVGDTEEAIFASAYLLATGRPLADYRQPATPVYVLAGAITSVLGPDIANFDRTAAMLAAGHALGLAASVAAVAAIALTVGRGLRAASLLATLSLVPLNASLLYHLNFFSENSFIVPTAVLTLVLVWHSLRPACLPPGRVVLAGAATGLAVAIKFVSLPLLAGGLVSYAVATLVAGAPMARERRTWWLVAGGWLALAATFVVVSGWLEPAGAQPPQGRLLVAGCVALAAVCAALSWLPGGRLASWLQATFLYLSGLGLGFAVAVAPVLEHSRDMLDFLLSLVGRSGAYGAGEPSTPASLLRQAAANAQLVWAAEPLLIVAVLGVGAGLAIWLAATWRRRSTTERALALGLLATSGLGVVLGLVPGSIGYPGQHPGVVVRYLQIPATAASFSLALALAGASLRGWPEVALAVALATSAGKAVADDWLRHVANAADGERVVRAMDAEIAAARQELGRPPLVLLYGVPRLSAFYIEAHMTYGGSRLDEVHALFPGELVTKSYDGLLRALDREPVDLAMVATRELTPLQVEALENRDRARRVPLERTATSVVNDVTRLDIVFLRPRRR